MRNVKLYEDVEGPRFIYNRRDGITTVKVKQNGEVNTFYIIRGDNQKQWTELVGCATLLSTPFEQDEELRKIKTSNRYTKSNTYSITLSYVFEICNLEEINKNEDYYIDEYYNVVEMYENTKTFGDIFDGLHKIAEKIPIDLSSNKFGI